MERRSKKITEAEREAIISESYKRGCVVSKLAKLHGISAWTIYNWRKGNRGKEEGLAGEVNTSGKFVELSVEGPKGATLEKASLTFDNLSVAIEGRIEVASLCSILKILGRAC